MSLLQWLNQPTPVWAAIVLVFLMNAIATGVEFECKNYIRDTIKRLKG